MSISDDLRVREATDADLPALSAMRAAAGWNVHEWALRMAIASPSIRFITVVRADRIVAMGSGAAYGPLGFVGNMLVAEDHRRRGIGGHVLETILAYLGEAGVVRIELYATSAGRPLYERYGFGPMEPGSRAPVPRGLLTTDRTSTVAVASAADGWREVAGYDAPRFGGDRSSLLAHMATDPDRPLLVARRGESIVGFAWLRPEDERLGPFLADTPEVAADLLVAAYEHMPDSSVLSMNLPTSNRTGMAWLGGLGVEIDPWDGRMGRGPEIPRRIETIYSNVVGALG